MLQIIIILNIQTELILQNALEIIRKVLKKSNLKFRIAGYNQE